MSVPAEPSFAELGMRVRLSLARALTETAKSWINDPGLPEEAEQAVREPAWCVMSARDGTGVPQLRAILPDALPANAFVAEAFRAVLGRPPDPSGLEHYVDALRRDPAGRGGLLETLATSAEGSRRGEMLRFSRREG